MFCVRLTGRNDDLVLLEEVTVREAEARVGDTVHLVNLFCRGGGGALEREKRLPRVSRLVTLLLMRSVLPCETMMKMIRILPVLLICTEYREGMM